MAAHFGAFDDGESNTAGRCSNITLHVQDRLFHFEVTTRTKTTFLFYHIFLKGGIINSRKYRKNSFGGEVDGKSFPK